MLSDNLWNFPESQSVSAWVKTRAKTDIHVEIIKMGVTKLWKWQLDAFGSEKTTTIILEIIDTQNENNNEILLWQLQPPAARQPWLWFSNHDPKDRAHGTTMGLACCAPPAEPAVPPMAQRSLGKGCRGGPGCGARGWTQWFLCVHCFYWMPQDFVQGSFDSSLQRNPVQVIKFLETTPVFGKLLS